jgi:hypothetical protein
MSKRLRTIAVLAAVMVASTQWGLAKCISLRITVEGEIVGATDGLTVNVEVPSKTKDDPVTHVSQKCSIDRARFRIVAWFDTTSNVIRKETCDRHPSLVIVRLVKGKQMLDQKTLSIETDFRETKEGNYEPVTQVVLNAPVSN